MGEEGVRMTIDPVAEVFRRWGYLQADVDPLGRLPALRHPDLDRLSGGEAERWRAVYCGPVGTEFMHMRHPDRCEWLAARLEEPSLPAADPRALVTRIAQAELFERFLHSRYVGTKRYSLE